MPISHVRAANGNALWDRDDSIAFWGQKISGLLAARGGSWDFEKFKEF